MFRFRCVFQRLRGLYINTTLKKNAMTAMQTVMAVLKKDMFLTNLFKQVLCRLTCTTLLTTLCC